MVCTIAAFELRQRFRRISTYVYFVVMFTLGFFFVLLSGGAFANASVDFGTGGRVLINSPYALFAVVVYISTFGVVITAALAGQATYQDIESNSTPFFYTAPISKFAYLEAAFWGAWQFSLSSFPPSASVRRSLPTRPGSIPVALVPNGYSPTLRRT
jgi:hypothetical protein